MDFLDFFAQTDDDKRKLSKILSRIFKEKPVNAFEIIRKNLVKVNDEKTKKDILISTGDKISIAKFLFKNENSNFIQKNHPGQQKKNFCKLNVIFKNQHILILNKEKGINVQPGNSGEENLTALVLEDYKNQQRTSLSFTPGPLHRIDRFTSGLVCFSQSLEGAKWFSENIQQHKIQKFYVGLAEGTLDSDEIWKDFISEENNFEGQKKQQNFHRVFASNPNDKNSKFCETKVFPVQRKIINGKNFTVCIFFIKTGRKHQIRLQSSLHQHPLAGDTIYGGEKISSAKKNINQFLLHSYLLIFPENSLQIPKKITTPLPKDFSEIADINLINQRLESII